MRKAAEYTLRLKKLYTRLKKSGAKSSVAPVDGAMEVLLLGILSNYSTEQKASAAIERIMAEMIDFNDLRVTPVADIVALMGVDFPHCRTAAEEISCVLLSVFNRTHDLDLSFLASFTKKPAASFLDSLDGLSPHAHAFFRNRFLKTHVIPLDANMYAYLLKNNCLSEGTGVADAQNFVSQVFKNRDAQNFYALLKRSAAAHAPRSTTGKSAGTSGGKTARKPSAGKAPAAGKTKKTAKKKTTRKKAARKKATPAKKRAGKSSKKATTRKAGARRR